MDVSKIGSSWLWTMKVSYRLKGADDANIYNTSFRVVADTIEEAQLLALTHWPTEQIRAIDLHVIGAERGESVIYRKGMQ